MFRRYNLGAQDAIRSAAAVLCICSTCLAGQSASDSRSIQRAYVDTAGFVHVVYADGEDSRIPGEKDQVTCDPPVVAPDNRTVGWLVEVLNCCTSYPIPTTLVIFKSGKVTRRINDGMMVYKWKFLNQGRQIAVSSGTVHGMNGIHLTLYDSRTGTLLKAWNGEDDDVPPKWGAEVSH